MAIRKPSLSVAEARRLASIRSAAAGFPPAGVNTPSDQPVAAKAAAPAVNRANQSGNQPPAAAATPKSIPPALAGPAPGTSSKAYQQRKPRASENQPFTKAKPASAAPAGPAIPTRPPTTARPRSYVSHGSEKIQVFLFAPLPAAGVSAVFETLCRQYSPQKSLQMILRRALDDYEEMLATDGFEKLPVAYASEETDASLLVSTSRMMPKTIAAIARAHFDPLGLESTRAFGYKLATAALAAFFAHENKRHG